MALAVAAVANGGKLFKPRLVLDVQERGARVLREWLPRFRMCCVGRPSPSTGPGRHAGCDRIGRRHRPVGPDSGARAAGKTGTAEIGRKHSGKKLGWMIAFAPCENPKYAIALMVEDAMTGGTTAAPLMRQLLLGLFPDARSTRGAG
jgi:cell division protein FtsI/penicillin-binding protein 2